MSSVPLVDAALVGLGSDPGEDDLADFGARLTKALSGCGFAILTGHGIPGADVEAAMDAARKFFSLPEEDKLAFSIGKHSKMGGYVTRGKESIDVHKEDSSTRATSSYEHRVAFLIDDLSATIVGDGVRGGDVSELRPAHERMEEHFSALGARVLRALALGIGTDNNFFYDSHPMLHRDNRRTAIRSNYYPPLDGREQLPPDTIRCGEHADFGTLTFVCQVLRILSA